KCTVATGAANPFGLVLGSFNTGRGSSDSLFDFAVTTDGYYPFRLLWWQGVGGANLEWFTVNLDTGEKILINQSDPNAVKAFRTGRGRAYVQSILPADGYRLAKTNETVTIVLKDDLTTVVSGSMALWMDGAQIPASGLNISKSGTTTTVAYTSPSGYPLQSTHTGTLVWAESTSPQTLWTNNFTFTARLLAPHDLPANSFWIEAEDF